MDPRAPTLRRRLLAELVRGASAAIEVGRGFFVVKIRSGEFFAASPGAALEAIRCHRHKSFESRRLAVKRVISAALSLERERAASRTSKNEGALSHHFFVSLTSEHGSFSSWIPCWNSRREKSLYRQKSDFTGRHAVGGGRSRRGVFWPRYSREEVIVNRLPEIGEHVRYDGKGSIGACTGTVVKIYPG
jgi:hypothetical protein